MSGTVSAGFSPGLISMRRAGAFSGGTARPGSCGFVFWGSGFG
jgi:hypothetical protein